MFNYYKTCVQIQITFFISLGYAVNTLVNYYRFEIKMTPEL